MQRWVGVLAAMVAACVGGQRVVTHHPDGSPKRIVTLFRGKQHGAFRTYHRNGRMAVRGRYANGLPDGEFVFHDPEGRLIKREIYRAGAVVWVSTKLLEEPPAALAPGPLPPFRPADIDGNFVTMSPLTVDERVSIDASTMRLRGDAAGGIGQQYNVYGQFRAGEWIGYGHGTAGWTQIGEEPHQASKLTVEAGAGRSFPLGPYQALLRLGLAAPVGHDDMDGFDGRAQLVYDRLTDAALAYPRAVVTRTGFSILGRQNWLMARIDAGLDFATGIGDADVGAAGAIQALAYLNLGGGIGDDNFSGTLELVNVAALTDDRVGERFAHSLALTGMFGPWRVRPRLGIVSPLDSSFFAKTVSIFAGVSYEP